MSNGAILNIVRALPLSSSIENDSMSAPELARHDEIKLVSPDGEPAATIGDFSEENIDYQYDYTSGATGYAMRGSRMSVVLPVDFISGALARKLERWKRERAAVWLCPGFGRNTMFSWRAGDIAGTAFLNGPSATDLTGQFSLQALCGQHLRYWHDESRTFLPKTTANRSAIVSTPAGAGLLTFPSVVNRMKPAYPLSGTLSSAPTASGWSAGGVDAADITASFVSNGFGLLEAPHALRVRVAAHASIDRYLFVANQWASAHADYAGYPFVNALNVTATVWVRGSFPNNATLVFGIMSQTDSVTRSLAGMRFDGWTPITVAMRSDTQMTGNAPYLAIGLNDSLGLAYEFEIGPTMVVQQSGYGGCGAASVWSPQVTGGTVSGVAHITTTSFMRTPAQGTLICSYYAPADIHAAWHGTNEHYTLCGNSDLTVYLLRSASSTVLYVQSQSSGTSTTFTSAVSEGIIRAGSVNTVAVTWDSTGLKLYVNGVLVGTDTSALPAIAGSSAAWLVGSGQRNYGCAPLAMLTCRVDEGAMTAAEIDAEHVLLTDPGILHFSIAARGRQFRVVETPMMVRGAYGGSQVFGPLVLEQCDYLHHFADPWNKERSVG